MILEDLRTTTSSGAAVADVWWRHVPDVAGRVGGTTDEWDPFASTKGYPGHWNETQFRGTFAHGIAGRSVTDSCTADVVADAFDSVIIALRVPPIGIMVKNFTVTYTDNGETKTLQVPWKLVGCGSSITDPEWCNPDA
ncbi:hypothetical protein [Nocardioides sp. Iso805N]|uniref:hypothetical protein n=1 Tax=Nocardioides sp. Iso805N TaxID=1283287 RepID=UPI00039C446F|nr:hypothetical protein [Nocardioides sp. Iso805N]